MNLSSVFIITTLITGFGEISKNEKGFDEMSLKFANIQLETQVSKEKVLSLEQCEDIIFGRGLREIFEPIKGNQGKAKVVFGVQDVLYMTSNNMDTANFRERKFEEPTTKNKHAKNMSNMDKQKVEIKYVDYRGVFNKKKVMECMEVKK